MTKASPGPFSVIQGGRDRHWVFGALKLRVAVAYEPPFFPDYELVEEDTWQVIGAGSKFREVHEHPVRLMTDVMDQTALEPGSCFRRGRRIFVVTHDLDQQPICRPEWVLQGMAAAFRSVELQHGESLSLAPPGIAHGRLPLKQSLSALAETMRAASATHLRQVWLHPPRARLDEVIDLLDRIRDAEKVAGS